MYISQFGKVKFFKLGLFSLMINRDNWGNLYLYSSGEMRRQYKDKLMRKHLVKVFSLIKNESSGIEDFTTSLAVRLWGLSFTVERKTVQTAC